MIAFDEHLEIPMLFHFCIDNRFLGFLPFLAFVRRKTVATRRT